MPIYESSPYIPASQNTNFLKLSLDGSDGEPLDILSSSIRTSQKLNIFYSKVFRKIAIKMAEGGVEFESNSSSAPVNPRKKGPDGRFAAGQMNTYLHPEGGFEFDSFRLCTTVNKAKMRPPIALCTIKAVGAERSLRSMQNESPKKSNFEPWHLNN